MSYSTSEHPSTARPRRCLRTFDIFDTLIARRCIEPHQVFKTVEARTGVAGFAAARIQAEQQLSQRDYTLADIYRQLQRMLSVDEQATDDLMRNEVLVELENVLPITEHVRNLPQDAVLVTDMYLPVPVIRELIKRAGIQSDRSILISTRGKSSGELWRHLAANGLQCMHLGDNLHSDVRLAREAGMKARLTSLARPTAFEQLLLGCQAPAAARAIRAARLQVVVGAVPEWLYRLQFSLNVPFLITSAVDLLHKASTGGVEKVLFASRDGRNLQALFEVLREKFSASAGLQAEYWYTSRCARTQNSSSYLDYCRQAFRSKVLVADLCGTGASTTALMRDLSCKDVPVYVAQKVVNPGYCDHMASCYGLGSSKQLLDLEHTFTTQGFVNNSLLEQLNYVPEGMIRDVHLTPFGPLPIRDALDFHGEGLALISAQQAMLSAFCYVRRNLRLVSA